MNVLITNPQEVQAYVILRSLRPVAERIVITEGGDSVASTGFRGMAAYSRFVDAKHRVPRFADDWLAGRLAPSNTEREEAYVRRLEEICRLEGIDVIFPSLDPEVYLLAKNKARLADQGVLAVVPEPEVIRIPMDKGLTIRAAQRAGFPCPRTWFPEDDADIAGIAADSEPPWIVKPRFTAHGAHMIYVDKAEELAPAYARVREFQAAPLVQEYIQGGLRRNYYLLADRQSQLLSVLTPEVLRTYRAGHRVSSKTCVSSSTGPYLDELRTLIADLGLWGGYTVQTQIDPRDGIPKLMEINPRLGQHLWWRTGLGVNEPLLLLQLARGEQPSGNLCFPEGVTFLDPYHDAFFLYRQCVETAFSAARRLLRRGAADSGPASDPDNPGTVWSTLKMYRREYLNRRPKLLCPEVSSFMVDPYPCLQAFWYKFKGMTGGYLRRAARAA
jgi:biotin carboxylase